MIFIGFFKLLLEINKTNHTLQDCVQYKKCNYFTRIKKKRQESNSDCFANMKKKLGVENKTPEMRRISINGLQVGNIAKIHNNLITEDDLQDQM